MKLLKALTKVHFYLKALINILNNFILILDDYEKLQNHVQMLLVNNGNNLLHNMKN